MSGHLFKVHWAFFRPVFQPATVLPASWKWNRKWNVFIHMKFRLLVTAQISLLLVKAIKSRETRQLMTHLRTGSPAVKEKGIPARQTHSSRNPRLIQSLIFFICAHPFGLIHVYPNLISVVVPLEKKGRFFSMYLNWLFLFDFIVFRLFLNWS